MYRVEKNIISTMKLGIDIGGTFTDLILFNRDEYRMDIAKTLTTYPDPIDGIAKGIIEILSKTGIDPKEIKTVVHGTTLVTNAVIERKGSLTGLITTAGFEDLLEIGRELRYDIYDLFIDMPQPLIERPYRTGVTERINKNGELMQSIRKEEVLEKATYLIDQGVEAIAVCYLHAYLNPIHEEETFRWIKEKFPQVYVSISSSIIPEIREYERLSTTAMNAYVQPVIERYLTGFSRTLKDLGLDSKIYIMLSNGSLTSIGKAIEKPVLLLESGPAGGVTMAQSMARILKADRLMAFDMGGTTAKASTLLNYKPEITQSFEAGREKRLKKGSGLPVRVPVIDLKENGAGGGSIARVNALGLLEVGPESASSVPGPACYGYGGILPTVTDAALVLGHLDPSFFLGGNMPLYPEKAIEAIQKHIATPLGIAVEEAAIGIQKVVTENMANAARVHAIEKGLDPMRFTLMAFGGAGPLHAFQVCKLLHQYQLVIPPVAGVSSSAGFLVSPFTESRMFSYIALLNEVEWSTIAKKMNLAEEESIAFLQKEGPPGNILIKRFADMRYRGQGWEVTIELPAEELSVESIPSIEAAFDAVYNRLYGRTLPGMAKEVISWRLECSILQQDSHVFKVSSEFSPTHGYKGTRKAFFDFVPVPIEAPVYSRYALKAGEIIEGPAIIEENESTTIIGRDGRFLVTEDRSIQCFISKFSYVSSEK